jgi:hypothetical protein
MTDLVERVAALIAKEYASHAAKDPSRYIARAVVDIVLDEAANVLVEKWASNSKEHEIAIRALGGKP